MGIKLKRDQYNTITRKQLKEIILRYYRFNTDDPLLDLSRKLIETKAKDSYGSICSILFSINGSPPKGRAIVLLNRTYSPKLIQGDIIFIGTSREISKSYPIRIIRR